MTLLGGRYIKSRSELTLIGELLENNLCAKCLLPPWAGVMCTLYIITVIQVFQTPKNSSSDIPLLLCKFMFPSLWRQDVISSVPLHLVPCGLCLCVRIDSGLSKLLILMDRAAHCGRCAMIAEPHHFVLCLDAQSSFSTGTLCSLLLSGSLYQPS